MVVIMMVEAQKSGGEVRLKVHVRTIKHSCRMAIMDY